MSAKKIRRIAKREAKKILGVNLSGQQHEKEQISTSPVFDNSIFEQLFENENSENERDLFNIDSDSDTEINEYSICEELGKWANEFSISFAAFNALLRCLNKCEIKVPKDGRTILKTPTTVAQRKIGDGVYVHYGIKNALTLHEVQTFKTALEANTNKLEALTEEVKQSRKNMAKLTEEVIAVKLENRKHHSSSNFQQNKNFAKLPFLKLEDLNVFNTELENNDELLAEFKDFIGKVGGDGQSEFLRTAIRKIFTDELACLLSWKGTKTKPSAEKLFIVSTIKNVCHIKYEANEKDVNSTLQKFFVYSKERLKKRKNKNN